MLKRFSLGVPITPFAFSSVVRQLRQTYFPGPYIQNNGNTFWGMSVYAQQVVSVIAVVLLIVLIVYLNLVVGKIKTEQK